MSALLLLEKLPPDPDEAARSENETKPLLLAELPANKPLLGLVVTAVVPPNTEEVAAPPNSEDGFASELEAEDAGELKLKVVVPPKTDRLVVSASSPPNSEPVETDGEDAPSSTEAVV